MPLTIISASQRLAEQRGVKALVVGPAGVGKTSLLRTLPLDRTLFVDLEAGDLAVQDLVVDTFRPATWGECRDLAVYLAGPNDNLPPTASYSRAHYDAVVAEMGDPHRLDKYDVYFVDSLTDLMRKCFRWCEVQPESFNDRGKKNLLGTYGLLAREAVGWLSHLQHARGKHVVFVSILERITDDFGVSVWNIQLEGGKTARELPGIVDEIITMQWVDFGSGKPLRAFVCGQPNDQNYPAKDRSGRLDLYEEPHLGKLLGKLTSNRARHGLDHTLTVPPLEDDKPEAA